MSQLKASQDVSSKANSLMSRVAEFKLPILIASGKEDRLIPVKRPIAFSQALPNAKLIVYPNAGHGFLFQYPLDFSAEVNRFLQIDYQR